MLPFLTSVALYQEQCKGALKVRTNLQLDAMGLFLSDKVL
jgi:hypothetical protein